MKKVDGYAIRIGILATLTLCAVLFAVITLGVWLRQTHSLVSVEYKGAHLNNDIRLFESRDDDRDGLPDCGEDGEIVYGDVNVLDKFNHKIVLGDARKENAKVKNLLLSIANESDTDAIVSCLVTDASVAGGLRQIGSVQAHVFVTDENGLVRRKEFQKVYFADFFRPDETSGGDFSLALTEELLIRAEENVEVFIEIQLESLETINAHFDSLGMRNMSEDEYQSLIANTHQTLIFSKIVIELADVDPDEEGDQSGEDAGGDDLPVPQILDPIQNRRFA